MKNKVVEDYVDEDGCLHCGICRKRKQMKVSLMGFEHPGKALALAGDGLSLRSRKAFQNCGAVNRILMIPMMTVAPKRSVARRSIVL